MTSTPKTADTSNQADANSGPNPVEILLDTAGDVVNDIAQRVQTHGVPDAFAATFAGLLSAYLVPVIMRNGGQVSPADALTVAALSKVARLAVAGPQPQLFRDVTAFGLMASVHTSEVFARGAAMAKAQAVRQRGPEPEAAPLPAPLVIGEGETIPATGTPERPVLDGLRGAFLGAYGADGAFVPAEPAKAPAPAAGDPEDDVPDADLIRWSLDSASDPWADLIRRGDGLNPDVPRPGVTRERIEERAARLRGLFENAPPEGVTQAEWRAAAERAAPLPRNLAKAA